MAMQRGRVPVGGPFPTGPCTPSQGTVISQERQAEQDPDRHFLCVLNNQ